MIDVAQQHLAQNDANGRQRLCIWASERDALRQDVLARQGYHRGTWPESKHARLLDVPLPDAPLPPGYTIRALGAVGELPARSWASWRAFHPDDPDEDYDGWEWYLNLQHMPLYRRDLDIVAIAPDGELAAFCTAWYDDVTRTGHFEPVGTVPEHQRRGLGKAVMCEAMRRLKRLGATKAVVGGYTPAANALYASVISRDCELQEPWIKEW
jgi:GNAT superfamily N-acetyltransferase